jgi:alkanesulfonate monooxygenase SsuD/methylene tetrahydromethanopterin reductase-like flavin-dependent oxidoreductase (luciferase family)
VSLRFGVVAAQGRPISQLFDDWRLIESLGFDNAWLIDHFAPPFAPGAPLLESWTALAALAARTTRVRLGVAVTNAAVRNPGVLIKQAITLDHVSGGRLEMAIGAGGYEEEQRMLGIPYPPEARGRAERLREVVQALDRGLRGKTVSLDGHYWKLAELPILPGPVQQPRPPIWVAAQGTYSLQTAAMHADVLVTMGDEGDPRHSTLEKVHARLARFAHICSEVGRDPAGVRIAYLVGWSDDRAFESEASFGGLVESLAGMGVTDFMFGFTSRPDSIQMATRAALERVGASLDSLRAIPVR